MLLSGLYNSQKHCRGNEDSGYLESIKIKQSKLPSLSVDGGLPFTQKHWLMRLRL